MSTSERPKRRGRLAAYVLLLAASACARAPASPHTDPATSPPLEDAPPVYYEEHEVDVPARPVEPIHPAYPPRLWALGLEGVVEARVVVMADGSVGPARLVKSDHDDFTAAVRAALRDARFHPARRAGRAVDSWVTLRLRFHLEE